MKNKLLYSILIGTFIGGGVMASYETPPSATLFIGFIVTVPIYSIFILVDSLTRKPRTFRARKKKCKDSFFHIV